MGRKKLAEEYKAKNYTFKLYDWEIEKLKEYIKKIRGKENESNSIRLCISLSKRSKRE